MARILYTWELGGGLGHIVPYIPLAKSLREKGHEVIFALHNLKFAESTLGKFHIPYMQAPTLLTNVADYIQSPHIFAQILHNVGYGDVDLLTGLLKGWQQLVEQYNPDLILYNHSPTALLATRDRQCEKVIIGTGFHLPPNSESMNILRNDPDMPKLWLEQSRVLDNINKALHRLGGKSIDRVTDIYQADEKILLTFKEMDHYPDRQDFDVTYWGVSSSGSGVKPKWPKGKGKRIFAYLKPFKTLPSLLETLNKLQTPSIIYAPEVSDEIKHKFSSKVISFSSKPLDMAQVTSECDVAITNATHATAISVLLSGKPQLLLPLMLEQGMVATNVVSLGAGLSAPRLHPQMMELKLKELLSNERYMQAAQLFADKHGGYRASEMEEKLSAHIHGKLSQFLAESDSI